MKNQFQETGLLGLGTNFDSTMDTNLANNNSEPDGPRQPNTLVFEASLEDVIEKSRTTLVRDIAKEAVILEIKEEALDDDTEAKTESEVIFKDVANEDMIEIKEEVLDIAAEPLSRHSNSDSDPDNPDEIEIDSSGFKRELGLDINDETEDHQEEIPKEKATTGGSTTEKSLPHVCSYCQKKFEYPSALKRHVVSHTKEKNFQCNICKKKFGSNNHAIRHYRLVTKSLQRLPARTS